MRNPWKLTSFALAALFAATIGGRAIQSADADPQPAMKSALDNLERAHTNLKNATADKGGHRVNAIGHVEKAIAEVKKGIKFDNKN
ncbi:MAG: hypothetical protein H0V17_36565 [Deltaproteobacteria bacterium]|nr:hypothetical protein [Deltaproteobacteria bacterium]